MSAMQRQPAISVVDNCLLLLGVLGTRDGLRGVARQHDIRYFWGP